jgi:hypothetical protein
MGKTWCAHHGGVKQKALNATTVGTLIWQPRLPTLQNQQVKLALVSAWYQTAL